MRIRRSKGKDKKSKTAPKKKECIQIKHLREAIESCLHSYTWTIVKREIAKDLVKNINECLGGRATPPETREEIKSLERRYLPNDFVFVCPNCKLLSNYNNPKEFTSPADIEKQIGEEDAWNGLFMTCPNCGWKGNALSLIKAGNYKLDYEN